MELSNSLKNNLETGNNVTLDKQKGFLQTNLGKIINSALNMGIRALLPDIIEDQVINIKDAIINNGFKAGVNEAISSAIDLGKSTIGIFTGKFESVTQARNAVKNGGIIDGISSSLDYALNQTSKLGKIPKSIANTIKTGKNVILNNVKNSIEKEFDNQINSVEKLSKYTQNWKSYYSEKDFSGMEKEYKKIKNEINNIMPLENTIKEARKIENLHTLIKNKGGNFDLSNEEIELAQTLVN